LDCKAEIARWLFEEGKRWIKNSDLRNLDRTALIFVRMLEKLDKELAKKLNDFYNKLWP